MAAVAWPGLAFSLSIIIKRDRYASESPLRKVALFFPNPKTTMGDKVGIKMTRKSVKFNIAVVVCY